MGLEIYPCIIAGKKHLQIVAAASNCAASTGTIQSSKKG